MSSRSSWAGPTNICTRSAFVAGVTAKRRHEIRMERRMLRQHPGRLPRCVAGCGPCPPEDIGGIERYLEAKDERGEFEFLDWLESLREGPIVLEDLRDEVDRWL